MQNPRKVIDAVEDFVRDYQMKQWSKASTDEFKNVFDRLRSTLETHEKNKISAAASFKSK